MITSIKTIQVRIDIDFPDCEVDMVFKRNMGASGIVPPPLLDGSAIPIDESKLDKTPIEETVDYGLHWLAGYVDRKRRCTVSSRYNDKDYRPSELDKLGVEVVEWDGLMMGNSHIIVEMDVEKFTPELLEKVQKIVHEKMKKYVKYYA
jgi:hypothetical protein